MTVEATPFVVEKLSANVDGCHGFVRAPPPQPVQRSSTVSPRRRTTSAPPPVPFVTSRPKTAATRLNPRSACPRTSGGREGPDTRSSSRLPQPPHSRLIDRTVVAESANSLREPRCISFCRRPVADLHTRLHEDTISYVLSAWPLSGSRKRSDESRPGRRCSTARDGSLASADSALRASMTSPRKRA